ncbi:MAG: hypothetical protein Q7J73_04830 [Dehalococcoidales bacterium]|nr:hypothetical protein [Dehalococcoidales bacterium]
METIRRLIARFRQSGLLLLIGFVLILYISFGFIYWQQKTQQTTLDKQIAQIGPTLSRPLASIQPLEEGLKKVNAALAEVSDERTAIALLVSIAEKNGISVGDAGKLSIPSPGFSTVTVGGDTFQLISFGGVHIQGDGSNVTAFLIDLDSGKSLENMVLKRVSISYTEIPFTANEAEQRAEFNTVTFAIKNMMADNGLSQIPKPLSFALGRATNFMGDDPTTNATIEGFPDNTTLITDKGYTGNTTSGNVSNNVSGRDVLPRNGYVLYQHDKILADNTSVFSTINYISTLKTKYYYTVETDGTVRQFSGPDLTTAVEYPSGKVPRTETIASIDVEIYTRAAKK